MINLGCVPLSDHCTHPSVFLSALQRLALLLGVQPITYWAVLLLWTGTYISQFCYSILRCSAGEECWFWYYHELGLWCHHVWYFAFCFLLNKTIHFLKVLISAHNYHSTLWVIKQKYYQGTQEWVEEGNLIYPLKNGIWHFGLDMHGLMFDHRDNKTLGSVIKERLIEISNVIE